MTRSIGLIGLLLGAGVLFGVACTGDPGTTTTSDGETTEAACPVGSLNCLCTAGGSCDGGLLCASKLCVEPDPQTTETEVTTTGTPTTGGEDSTTGSSCAQGGAGNIDPACPSETPYCVQGECVPCGEIECARQFPSLPACDPDTGRCAACVCDEAAPVCDPVAHTCNVCTAHSECGDGACDMFSGACIPASATLWVDDDGACDDSGEGTEASPLCSLSTAFQRIGAAPQGAHAVRVQPGTYSVENPLRATAGHVVALVHATGGADDAVVRILAASSPALAIDAGGAMMIDGVLVKNAASDGLSCAGGKVVLDRVTIDGGAARGLATSACDIRMRRSVLVGNKVTGAEVRGGALDVENSYITGNGNTQSGGGGIYLAEGATLAAVYTTWVDNLGQAGTPFSVACDEDPGAEAVAVRNSVVINKGFNTLCDSAMIEDTAWSTDDPQSGHLAVAYAELGDYLKADGTLPGVYRPTPGTALDGLAKWKAGDPAIDFDGDARPAGDNAPDFAGADRVAR